MITTRPSPVTASPLAGDLFQRAVFKAAPKRFTIEFLPPTKIGSGSQYYYGMRICSISKRLSISSISSSGSSKGPYDVWRTWEDCLWLQNELEHKYSCSARERRVRLAQGKGVKAFNGMYKQDMASSWESLPPGPEPTSVSTDIHTYLPALVKKATLFRAKPATIERRQNDFQAMIEVLMSDEVPALIKEIRATREITDFFGYWRRDLELEEKLRKQNPQLPRSSLHDAIFSTYYPTNPSLSGDARSSKRSLYSTGTARPTPTLETLESAASSTVVPSRRSVRSRDRVEILRTIVGGVGITGTAGTGATGGKETRRHSSSSDSSAQSEEAVSDASCTANSCAPKVAEDSPLKYNYSPERGPEPPSPVLEDIRDDHFSKLPLKMPMDMANSIHIHRRGQSEAGDRKSNRTVQVYSSPLKKYEEEVAKTEEEKLPPIRESWMTALMETEYLADMDIDFPGTPKDDRFSMQSFATLHTIDSRFGVLPLSRRNSEERYYELHMPRASVPVSLSDFDIFSESDGKVSLLTSSPRPLSNLAEETDSRPETPIADDNTPVSSERTHALARLRIPLPSKASFFSTPSPVPFQSPPTPSAAQEMDFPHSPTNSRYSDSFSISTTTTEATTVTPCSAWSLPSPSSTVSSPKTGSSLTLKVSLTGSIIVLKVSRDISYQDLRQRIYNKFVGQEGIPLSHTFEILQPSGGENRSPKTIDSDFHWSGLSESFEGSKLLLWVIDAS